MDPITFVGGTNSWKTPLNQCVEKAKKKPKNLLILFSGRTQSNLKDFKQQDIMLYPGHCIINLFYLACLCITVYFKRRRRRLIMTVSQSTSLRGCNTFFCYHRSLGSKRSCTTQSSWQFANFLDPICLHSCSHGVLLSRVGLVLLLLLLLLSSPLPSVGILVWIRQVSVTNPTCPHTHTIILIFHAFARMLQQTA